MVAPKPNLEGASSGFTLIKALLLMLPHVSRKQHVRCLRALKKQTQLQDNITTLTLADGVVKYPMLVMAALQRHFKILFLVVITFLKSNCRVTKLLYDGRHVMLDTSYTLHCFVLNKTHQLKQYTTDVTLLPQLHSGYGTNMKNSLKHSLITLLELDIDSLPLEMPADPQSGTELIAFMAKYLPPHTKVCITYSFASRKHCVTKWYESPSVTGIPIKKVVALHAFASTKYAIMFTPTLNPTLTRGIHQHEKTIRNYERYQSMWTTIKEKEAEKTNPHQMCRTSSISLCRTSLNLAYDLGLVKDRAELAYLSNALAQTQSAIFVFLDDQHHLRHITYYDVEKTFSTQVVCCQNDCHDLDKDMPPQQQHEEQGRRIKASKTMFTFWTMVWERRKRWIERRLYLLKPLVAKLEILASVCRPTAAKKTTMQTPFTRCLTDLKRAIFNHRIYMYSSQDSHLHAIKFYLTDYAYCTTKRCRGVMIKAQGDSTLTTLSMSGLTIVNLYNYFDCTDQHFFTPQTTLANVSNIVNGPKPSEVFILHNQRDLLKHYCTQASTDNGKAVTLNNYCKQKGKEWSKHILYYWSQFGLYLLHRFGHDVHGQTNYASASYLGFQCLWTAFVQMSGPLTHSLEKTKPYYEDLIRGVSKGGFMFSIEDSIEKGNPLWPTTDGIIAQSIAEMDLISAYGYGASRASMPTGFCTGYQRIVDTGDNVFERLDHVGRHRSFEFKAVYKTIYDLAQQTAIRTVYSNFSPFGIFCLGPYPIDLVIITETGQMLLYQMDGAFCHGCTSCLPMGRYLNGQTHQQVREKTNARDASTLEWIDLMNAVLALTNSPLVQYTVIQDCCTAGYSSRALETAFQTVPELAKLVRGYSWMDNLSNPCTLSDLLTRISNAANPDFTFITQASVSIHSSFTPLIVYESRPDTYTRQRLSTSGSVVLTRDYFQWLLSTFQDSFKVITLDWILFYAKEPLWNQLFTELTQLRSTTKDPILVAFLKRIINLTCGFFGARTMQQDNTTYRLVNTLPHNYAFYRHYPDINYTMDVGLNSYFLLETKPWPKLFHYRKASKSALPMFLTIVEYGKLRLIDMLHYIQQHVYPDHFRLLYSNIDNIIYALSNADTLDQAIQPIQQGHFDATKHLYFTPTDVPLPFKPPGLAELKWLRKGDCSWKFISIRTQHYCLVVDDTDDYGHNVHKTSGWSNVSSREAFQAAKNILDGRQVTIIQTRRINKKSNMMSHQVTFAY